MENDNQQRVKSFYRILEEGVAKLPADVRGALYRPCAVDCVKDDVLRELRRQFEECGRDLDRQYTKYGRSEYFFADIIEPGRVYEVGYPRCLCPQVDAGFVDSPAHCECSRQSILYVMEELLPGKDIRVEELETVLSGRQRMPLPDHCRVAHCGAWLLQAASGARALGAGMVAAQNKKSRSQCFGIFLIGYSVAYAPA